MPPGARSLRLTADLRARNSSRAHSGTGPLARFMRAAGLVYPERHAKAIADRALFVLRSAACYGAASTWYEWLERPRMAAVARSNTSLYRKIIRPYLTPRCTTDEKLTLLLEHYGFMTERLQQAAFEQLCTPEGLSLLHFESARGDAYELRLASDGKFRKEGEHSLQLFSERHAMKVQTLTFLVGRRPDGARQLLIGGTQGLPKGADRSVTKEVTKSLHGLRPKAFLLFATQQLAAVWHLAGIRAVGSAVHVSRHWDYRLNRVRRPAIAYDEFWAESGGIARADGFWDLPVSQTVRPSGEVKTNKRSLYAHRYAMLETIGARLRESLAQIDAAEPPRGALPATPRRQSSRHVRQPEEGKSGGAEQE